MRYFAIIDGEKKGPFEITELAEAGVGPDTYIWCKGMNDWQKARTDADICREFRRRVTDILHPALSPAEQQPQMPPQVSFISHDDLSKPPPNILPAAILVTILCLSPFTGIIAIITATKSRSAWKKNRPEEAYELARQAKMWTGITFFMGFITFAVALTQVMAN